MRNMLELTPGSRVVVAGAGLMGAQIAAEYALAGYSVVLTNRSPESAERAVDQASAALQVMIGFGLTSGVAAEHASNRMAPSSDLSDACRGAGLVVESIAEDFDAKVDLLHRVGGFAPDAVLATNTSSLPINDLGERSGTARRLIGTHYWNPPTLMPLVEVVVGKATEPAVTDLVLATLRRIGKEPVIVPDIPGFVWNRLQFALLREAAALVQRKGVAPEVIDLIVRRGLGRRWSILGPFQIMALGGPATFASVAQLLFPDLASDLDASELRRIPLADEGDRSAVVGRRNQELAAWLRRDRENA